MKRAYELGTSRPSGRGGGQQLSYRCVFCGREFASLLSLTTHLHLSHNDIAAQLAYTGRCLCGHKTRTAKGLVAHAAYKIMRSKKKDELHATIWILLRRKQGYRKLKLWMLGTLFLKGPDKEVAL